MDSFRSHITRSYQYNADAYVKDSRWKVLEELYQKNFIENTSTKPKLPKRIHQIWLGSPFPNRYKDWAASWQKMHPDWEYRLWTDENLDEVDILNRQFFNSISNYGPKSDYLRYHLLRQFGGLYVDTDFECLKPFDSLRYLNFLIGVGYPMQCELYVGLIGATPNHPVLELACDTISKCTRDFVLGEVFSATSSYFFTKAFFDVVKDYQKDVLALPPEYLYPFPNHKGHEIEDGRKYIKEFSFANHYWEVSWATRKGLVDWIQGERFREVADFTYTPSVIHSDDYTKYPNTFRPSELKEGINCIYTHTVYVKQLFNILKHLKGEFVVISHNGDVNIDNSFEVPGNVVRWFSQNVNHHHPRLQSLPIGLENNMWMRRFDKRGIMNEQWKKNRKYKNLLYLNHNVKTNPKERQKPYDLFALQKWCTAERGQNGMNPSKYFANLYNHKFVCCPEGNGIDTHRTWETLYMGSIPIEKRNVNNSFYQDLPICFVNSWEEVTEEFLLKEWDRIKETDWDLGKLNLEYWKTQIRKACTK